MAVMKTPPFSGKHHRWAQAVQRRYLDGYRLANGLDAFGQFMKFGCFLYSVSSSGPAWRR